MEDEVDFGSDTSVQGGEGTMSQSPVLEDKSLSAPNPFPTQSDVNAPLAQYFIPI